MSVAAACPSPPPFRPLWVSTPSLFPGCCFFPLLWLAEYHVWSCSETVLTRKKKVGMWWYFPWLPFSTNLACKRPLDLSLAASARALSLRDGPESDPLAIPPSYVQNLQSKVLSPIAFVSGLHFWKQNNLLMGVKRRCNFKSLSLLQWQLSCVRSFLDVSMTNSYYNKDWNGLLY